MVTLTLLCLIVWGEGGRWRGQTANFGKKALKMIDNFPPGAFYSPRPLRQLGKKE